jgi:vitamin K-dependent gamma-carboxylase-like protein
MSGSASLGDWLGEVRRFASVKHRTIALSFLRISIGLTVLVYYLQHILQREYLWDDAGLVPFSLFQQIMQLRHGFSLYLLSPSFLYQTAVFYLGLAVTIAFILGYRLRISSILFYVFTWSLFERNIFLLTGGDNFLYLVAFFLIFADCGAHFSLDAISGRSRTQSRPFAAMVHNYAVLAIIIQLSLVYLTSAFYKIEGPLWQNGTAIYYVLRLSEFNLSPFARHFYDTETIVRLLTWGTVVFEMSWPFLVWNRRTKPFVALGAVFMHSMIGYFMGLVWFSFVFIVAQVVIFKDSELIGYAARVREVAGSARASLIALMPHTRGAGGAAADADS